MSTTQQAEPRRNALALALRSHARVALVLAAAVVFQLAFIASFTGAMSRPTLQDATVGLVASPIASRPAATAVPQVGGVSYQVLPSPAAAAAQVRDGALPAALLIGARNDTLVVAGAAGLSLVTAITEEVSAHAARAGVPVAVEDVRPLPPGDPRGLGSYLLVLGWIIGGYLGMTLLGRVRGAGASVRGTAVTLGMAALYSVASAALGVALVGPLMGVLTGHTWTLFAAGSLIVFATTVVTAALTSLVGLPGIVIAIVMFVVLGNPTSGGSVPVQMLAGGYRFLAGVLPTNAAMGLVRGFAYFDGNQIVRPLLVLSIYAGASLAVCLGLALRRAHATVAKESAARAGTGEVGTGRQPRAGQHVVLPTGASR
jgi:hypothetical protein